MINWLNLLAVGVPLAAALTTPSFNVPSCTVGKGTVKYDRSVPNGLNKFPLTQVDMCYSDTDIEITFTAYQEVNFFYNASQKTNDPIYNYEVMESFIYKGTNDPQTYFEFEVSPNNVTWQAFIYNPSKVRAAGAPFDNGQLQTPQFDGLVTSTYLNKPKEFWQSNATIPLGLFDVDSGEAKGTQWRMNFFRTVVAPATYPNQTLGAWSPTNQSNFHMTPFFGHVSFV
ncbi:hypothetical protein F5Y16DRAFT_370089 [Xylariaceae sp. FL0255]|nr:hypothetical protein F5Y16DRAFT_370089 [Xylariaceae sp. FL0255]